ncbi:hypothetical protein HO133_009578 [Letharia lupina]|uniref:Uncharacterized protein n=1 Tax=Letharia lupina TaxID=560253 RepID=A0A8H6CLB2_9LECA|nr:uncharacterized protein HO133_009578 [Letharia lupina]KAF6225578.1 hypothetical protein HO133_009578 [Letharia lupina]
MRFLTYTSIVVFGLVGLVLSLPASLEAKGASVEEDFEPPVPGSDLRAQQITKDESQPQICEKWIRILDVSVWTREKATSAEPQFPKPGKARSCFIALQDAHRKGSQSARKQSYTSPPKRHVNLREVEEGSVTMPADVA